MVRIKCDGMMSPGSEALAGLNMCIEWMGFFFSYDILLTFLFLLKTRGNHKAQMNTSQLPKAARDKVE